MREIITETKKQDYKLELLYLLNEHVWDVYVDWPMTLPTMHCGSETLNLLICS